MCERVRRSQDSRRGHPPEQAPERRRQSPADAMLALQRTLGNAGVGRLLRAQKYLRAEQDVPSGEKDIATLSAEAKLPKGELPPDLSWWLEGMGAMSTTRYNPGQKHYYSPVGLVIELERDEQVLGNYAGDGNTGTLVPGMTEPDDYWTAFEKIRVALQADQLVGGPWGAHAGAIATTAITDEGGIGPLKTTLQTFLKSPLDKPVKDQAVKVIEAQVVIALQAHYRNRKRVKKAEIPIKDRADPLGIILGPGLDPLGLSTMEQALLGAEGQKIKHGESSEEKYTESKAHVRLADVKASYFNTEEGAYPTLITDAWRKPPTEEWKENRWQAAETLRQKVPGAELKKLEGGHLVASEPPAPKAGGAAAIPENVRAVMQASNRSREDAEFALSAMGGDVDGAVGLLATM